MPNFFGCVLLMICLIASAASPAIAANDAKSVLDEYIECWETVATEAKIGNVGGSMAAIVRAADHSCMMKRAYAISMNGQAKVLKARDDLIEQLRGRTQ